MKIHKYIIIIILSIFLIPKQIFAEPITGVDSVHWSYEDGVLTLSGEDVCITDGPYRQWYSYKDQIKKIIIEDGIDGIGNRNFENYPNLEEVVFPKSMGSHIGDYAFYNCPKLEHVELPIGFSLIGEYAFYGTGIEEVEIPIYCDWVKDNAFNEDTIITRPEEYEDLIAAGTAGNAKVGFPESTEGRESDDTCYIKNYYLSYYNDTAYWKLKKDGTLIIWGKDLIEGYTGSRVPWGCYKSKIKKIIFNDDKYGKIINEYKENDSSCMKYAVYSSSPVEDIMNNRIQELKGAYLWDCREDCLQGMRNLETVIVNRGVKTIINNALKANQTPNNPKDIYISKYVETISDNTLSVAYPNQYVEKNIHLEVSYEDYLNNNYNYEGLVDENGFKSIINGDNIKGNIVNNINKCYVSINDDSVPKTKIVDGQTLYLYEVYGDTSNKEYDISIPNDTNDYYIQEITNEDTPLYKIDNSNEVFEVYIRKEKEEIINPKTSNKIMMFIIVLISMISILLISNKKKEKYN